MKLYSSEFPGGFAQTQYQSHFQEFPMSSLWSSGQLIEQIRCLWTLR